jgi:outer membrane protein assembly factor BamB
MRLITLLLLLVSLTGCAAFDTVKESVSGISDYFSGGQDNADPPEALHEYAPEVQVDVLWKERVGVGADEQSLRLLPAIANGKVIAADRNGLVQARDMNTGALRWEIETGVNFSGGPGVGRGSVVLGSNNAEVVAINPEDGSVLWKTNVSSEILSIPAIANNVVIVRTTDGAMFALDEKTGHKVWNYESSIPALSVRGSSSPVIVENNVISGNDSGKLVALRLSDGKFVWETSIAIPKGRSEVERLVDVDVDPIASGGNIYIASYHGGVAAISETDGEVLWRNEDVSSYAGMASDYHYLYLSDSESHVWQLDQHNGSSLWKQKDLHQRKLTAPVAYGSYVVVADFEGYVHWLSSTDGRQLGRVQITDGPIDAKPVVVDNTVYVYAKDGTLAALKIR